MTVPDPDAVRFAVEVLHAVAADDRFDADYRARADRAAAELAAVLPQPDPAPYAGPLCGVMPPANRPQRPCDRPERHWETVPAGHPGHLHGTRDYGRWLAPCCPHQPMEAWWSRFAPPWRRR